MGESGPWVKQEYLSAQSRKSFPLSGQLRVPIHMLGVEVTRHKNREPAVQASGKVRLDQGSEGER